MDSEPAMRVRRAVLTDADRIAEIYNQGIVDRTATFETRLLTSDDVRGWFALDYPIIVVSCDDRIVGWSNASSYRSRECYARNAEFSFYVDRAWRRRGVGRIAMTALIHAARESGLEKLISRVFIENTASRRLLAKLGFREVGVYERHAQLDGVWRDVVIVELLLVDRSNEPRGILWQPDFASMHSWKRLIPGTSVTVEKVPWEPDKPVTRYPGDVVESAVPSPWVEIRATWELPDGMDERSGLRVEHGAELREFFSPQHPFNAFGIYDRSGAFQGWYANVTRPARLYEDGAELVLSWSDLVLDCLVNASDEYFDADEDEIPDYRARVAHPIPDSNLFGARNALRALLQAGFFPVNPS